MARGGLKGRLYPEFARVSQALASERRIELLDVLAQAPRRVEALADETGMTIANVSQHLQVLKNARLVESERHGTSVTYRLASPSVLRLWLALTGVAEERLPEVARLRLEHRADDTELSRADLARLLRRKDVVLVDVRPAVEFQHGHIPGAISMPLPELPARIDELPRDKRIVAYCRGTYCLMADDAVALLRERGFDAVKLDGGWPEWAAEHSFDEAAGTRRRPSGRRVRAGSRSG